MVKHNNLLLSWAASLLPRFFRQQLTEPLRQPANVRFSSELTWIELKCFNLTALLYFPYFIEQTGSNDDSETSHWIYPLLHSFFFSYVSLWEESNFFGITFNTPFSPPHEDHTVSTCTWLDVWCSSCRSIRSKPNMKKASKSTHLIRRIKIFPAVIIITDCVYLPTTQNVSRALKRCCCLSHTVFLLRCWCFSVSVWWSGLNLNGWRGTFND